MFYIITHWSVAGDLILHRFFFFLHSQLNKYISVINIHIFILKTCTQLFINYLSRNVYSVQFLVTYLNNLCSTSLLDGFTTSTQHFFKLNYLFPGESTSTLPARPLTPISPAELETQTRWPWFFSIIAGRKALYVWNRNNSYYIKKINKMDFLYDRQTGMKERPFIAALM